MIDVRFGDGGALWLLTVPCALAALWGWRALGRRSDLARLRRARLVPVAERVGRWGDLPFWLAAIVAIALLVVAVARPALPTTLPRRAGLDVVVLQDGSASMRVADVAGEGVADRWQRSMRFLRALGDALAWTDDRLGLIVFAHVATPQIRLTRDPNTLFFFLDHLTARAPFRLEDDTTWDTNLEHAVGWGLRLVEKDREIHGRSRNGTLFVLVSDGEQWSGEAARAIAQASARDIPLFVVGVGTLGGAPLPVVRLASGAVDRTPGTSRLERAGLRRLAAAGRGDYFELDRDGDRQIASQIVSAGRRLAPSLGLQDSAEEVYWWLVAAAALCCAAGLASLRQPGALGVLLAGSVVSALLLWPLLG